MAFVFRRENVRFWWMSWRDADGREHRASSRTVKKSEAQSLADELERQARARGRRVGVTVQQFYDQTWERLRRELRPHSWMSDYSTMSNYFLPEFGTRTLAEQIVLNRFSVWSSGANLDKLTAFL